MRDEGASLIGCLKSKGDRSAQIDLAFWTVLSRPALAEERSSCEAFLTQRETNVLLGLRQLVWSLLASPELRFNH